MKKLSLILLLSALFLTRIFDFYLVWTLGELEMKRSIKHYKKSGLKVEDLYYFFIGFSNYKSAKSKLNDCVNQRKEKVIVVSYFDFIHPNIYLIFNKGEKRELPLSWMGTYIVDTELTEIFFYKFDYVKFKRKDKIEGQIIPIAGSIVSTFIKDSSDSSSNKILKKQTNSANLYFTFYLDKIYVFYFYFPLISIVLLSFLYKKSIFISFIYYFEMSLLFIPKLLFECAILCWLTCLFDNIPKLFLWILFFTFMIIIIFIIKMIILGFKAKKRYGIEYPEKIIITYFLLLPLFIRF